MIREFLRAVFGKNRVEYAALTQLANDAHQRNKRAMEHFNKAMDIHKMVEARRTIQRREANMLAHGARSFKGGIH